MQGTEVVTDALIRINKLYPGESLDADLLAFGLTRLNLLVDELSATSRFLYQTVLTSAAQTGNITLAAGDWAAIPVGTHIEGMTADGAVMSKMSMAQYAGLSSPTTAGTPHMYAPDGKATIYLYPVPAGTTIQIRTRVSVTAFADATTEYTVPPGYENYLGAALAVRFCPTLARLTPDLTRAEMAAKVNLRGYTPAIVDVCGYSRSEATSILEG